MNKLEAIKYLLDYGMWDTPEQAHDLLCEVQCISTDHKEEFTAAELNRRIDIIEEYA